MSDLEVDGAFTRAGRRFTDLPSFQVEEEKWMRSGSANRLVPNSRFGIGVFSYFLLAEEVEVYSVRQSPDGALQRGIQVHLSSASGLTTRKPLDQEKQAALSNGGTLVRLFLNEPEWDGLNATVAELLEEILGYSEFELRAEQDGLDVGWAAGEFIRLEHKPVVAFSEGGVTAWWVSGEVPLLADGVRLASTTVGYLVNLGGSQRPSLDVSRNRVLAWDSEWVERELGGCSATLASWQGLSIEWFWSLSESGMQLAETLYRSLQGSGVLVSLGGSDRDVPLEVVGVTALDSAILEHSEIVEATRRGLRRPTSSFARARRFPGPLLKDFLEWRRSVWVSLGRSSTAMARALGSRWSNPPPPRLEPNVVRTCMLPLESPSPVDGRILLALGEEGYQGGSQEPTRFREVSPRLVVSASSELSISTSEIFRRAARYSPTLLSFRERCDDLIACCTDSIPTVREAQLATLFFELESETTAEELGGSDLAYFYWELSKILISGHDAEFDLGQLADGLGVSSRVASWLRELQLPPKDVMREVESAMNLGSSIVMAQWLKSVGIEWSDPQENDALVKHVANLDGWARIVASQDLDGNGPWLTGHYGFGDVLSRAILVRRSFAEIQLVLDGLPGVSRSPGGVWPLELDNSRPPHEALKVLSNAKGADRGSHLEAIIRKGLPGLLFPFLEALFEYDIAATVLVDQFNASGLGVPGEWGSLPRPESRKTLAALDVCLASARRTGWPVELSVVETLKAANILARESDLSDGLERIGGLSVFGVVSLLESPVSIPDHDAQVRALLSDLLWGGMTLRSVIGAVVDATQTPPIQWLDDHWWWLKDSEPNADVVAAALRDAAGAGRPPIDYSLIIPVANLALCEGRSIEKQDVISGAAASGIELGTAMDVCSAYGASISQSALDLPRECRPDYVDVLLAVENSARVDACCAGKAAFFRSAIIRLWT